MAGYRFLTPFPPPNQSRDVDRAAAAANPGLAVAPGDPAGARGVPGPLVYQKGAWTLHMLRGLVGEDAFRSGVREYYRQIRDGNATTADFRGVMERSAGTDLDWFFRQWLYRGGFPRVSGDWTYDPATRRVVIDLTQLQADDPYRLTLEVGIDAAGPAARTSSGST